jgi:CMP-N-acetylneuraminic acid synthetase
LPEILTIIPARGGSKRIPQKNLKSLGDKPLIAWTIVASLASPSVTRTVVSTDSQQIADISKLWGAEVPVMRPPELARDEIHSYYPINQMLTYLELVENYVPDIVVMLLATSPLRRNVEIEAAIKLYIESKAESVISVCDVCPIQRIRKIDENGYLQPVVDIDDFNFQTQDVEESYMLNISRHRTSRNRTCSMAQYMYLLPLYW